MTQPTPDLAAPLTVQEAALLRDQLASGEPVDFALLDRFVAELSRVQPARCDCGAALIQCSDCAVADWQGAHPECVECCPRPVQPAPQDAGGEPPKIPRCPRCGYPTRTEEDEAVFKRRSELLDKRKRTKAEEAELEELREYIMRLPTARSDEDQAAMDLIRRTAKLIRNQTPPAVPPSGAPRKHVLFCDEYHQHTPPFCCDADCWCLVEPSGAVAAPTEAEIARTAAVDHVREILAQARENVRPVVENELAGESPFTKPPVAADPQLRERLLQMAEAQSRLIYRDASSTAALLHEAAAALAAPERDGEPVLTLEGVRNLIISEVVAWSEWSKGHELLVEIPVLTSAIDRQLVKLRHPPADTGGERVRDAIEKALGYLAMDRTPNDAIAGAEQVLTHLRRSLAASGTPSTETDDG